MGMKDPVDIDELRHDIDSAKRLAEQDRLEAEFKRDPDWDLVAEYLLKRQTMGDILSIVWSQHSRGYAFDQTVFEVLKLAIEQCAREYAEREASR
jgi:hypothetical protein